MFNCMNFLALINLGPYKVSSSGALISPPKLGRSRVCLS
jgi:hypothetical protein